MAEKTIAPSLPLGTVKRLMKENCPDNLVGKDAILEMERTLTQVLKNVTTKAAKIAANGKRKTISASDISIACE